MSGQPSYPRSNLLVLAFNSVQALLPTTLIDKAEAYLDVHRIDDAVALADEQRKKLQAQLAVDAGEADALQYVHLRIGFKCMLETRFEDAGYHLFEGGLDPRLLISYYPDLRGSLLSEEDDVELFDGVADNIVPFDSVDDISMYPFTIQSSHMFYNSSSLFPIDFILSLLFWCPSCFIPLTPG